MTNLRWYRMARTTQPFRIGLMAITVATAVGWTHASQSVAASDLTVDAQAPTAGTPATTGPVVVSVHTTVTADQPGAPVPQLRTLGLRMPAGFSTAVAGIQPCDARALETGGSAACAASKLGTGKASVRVSGLVEFTATTQELSIFRGTGETILAYARITRPQEISVVLPGRLLWHAPDAPLLTLDLRKILQPAGMRAAVTSADITLTQGLTAGPCPTGSWMFKAQLDFVDATRVVKTPSASCAPSPASAPSVPAPPAPAPPLLLRASARKSTRASGARFSIHLSAPATIKVTLERRAAKRWVVVRRASVKKRAGSSSLTIRKARGRRLPAGRYRSHLQAMDAAGAASAPQIVRFPLRR